MKTKIFCNSANFQIIKKFLKDSKDYNFKI